MFIGVDIGGSNMVAGLFDENKKLITTAKVKSKAKEETEVVVGQLFKVIDKLITEIPTDKKLQGIGIGVAGLIDKKTSVVRRSVNINLNGVNLKQLIQDKYVVKSVIDNDVNVGILGEAKYGAGVGCDDIIGAFVGTGIGGGLVLNGKLYTGNSGLAAELGHTIIKQGGAYCPGCGSQGCLEAYAGKVGIEKKIENLAKKKVHSTLIDLVIENSGKLKSSHIKKALDEHDEIAMDILNEAMEYLGTGLGSALNMINPSMVILGGGVMEAIGEKYLSQVKKAAIKNSFADIYAECDFKLAKLGDQAGIYGAMELVAS
ncbi:MULTISPECIES: ROK family protein [Francisella]|uniref:ROK family protein n=1 Tax=Francisella opportunistica TaxID=2016517 RepID=A0A345JQG2_9GAMM|nr:MULTISPECIES: ROK family protein [Francisella]APC91263.1 Putative ROK-family transcriptional regulator [Francisella sp. MA067296]AXH29558.1 ROK family protein [Francisella opportunistica]AXH31209.1 ROK family protein [Francisella opportunistica]AXH32856.1 ROK family protein [Francisella opportunistica]